MEGDAPVLTDRKDIKMWKRLESIERSAGKGSKKDEDKLRKIIREILDMEDYANPKIVVKVIDLVDLYMSDELQPIMIEILEKCKLTEYSLQLHCYKKIFEEETGIPIKNCYLCWFSEKQDNYKIMKCQDVANEAAILLTTIPATLQKPTMLV
jgi:hypothetical protein